MQSLEAARQRYPGAETFRFGDTEEICDYLLGLVRSGQKTGTAEALAIYESGAEAMPKVGRKDIALEWSGAPAVVVETLSLEIAPFDEVTWEFAQSEGENDSLRGWQETHQAYFARAVGFDPKMMVVCERFRVIEDLAELGKTSR